MSLIFQLHLNRQGYNQNCQRDAMEGIDLNRDSHIAKDGWQSIMPMTFSARDSIITKEELFSLENWTIYIP